jgi:hypothetical protein
VPRRNRNAWRNPGKKRIVLDVDPSPTQLQPATRRERRKAQRAFNNADRKAA